MIGHHSKIELRPGYFGSRSATASRCCGITLLEVLVAIFTMGVGMLPLLSQHPEGALRIREAINADRAADDTIRLSQAIEDFQGNENHLPTLFLELTPYLNGDTRFEDGEEDGYWFSMDSAGAVTADPTSIGKTGVQSFLKPLGQSLLDITTPSAIERAEKIRQIMLDNIRALTAEASADVLRLDTSNQAPRLARGFCSSQTMSLAFATMDTDHNGLINWSELLAPNPEIPRVTKLNMRVASELDLGAGDENLDAFPGLTIEAFQGYPGFVYTFDTMRRLVQRYVAPGGLRTSLISKLNQAEAAADQGQISKKDMLLKAFIRQVQAHQGSDILLRDATTLVTLAQTL